MLYSYHVSGRSTGSQRSSALEEGKKLIITLNILSLPLLLLFLCILAMEGCCRLGSGLSTQTLWMVLWLPVPPFT